MIKRTENCKTNFTNKNSYNLKRELMLLFHQFEVINKLKDEKTKALMFRQLDDKCRGLANYFNRPAKSIANELHSRDAEWYNEMEQYAKKDKYIARQLETYKIVTENLGFLIMH